MSARERTGWRDLELSLRHRAWGFNCPMVDIDFLVCEYDQRKVVALIEYKFYQGFWRRPDASYEALQDLADRARVPFFLVYYVKEPVWYFSVFACNNLARVLVHEPLIGLTEERYVAGLYVLRHRQIPPNVRHTITRGLCY